MRRLYFLGITILFLTFTLFSLSGCSPIVYRTVRESDLAAIPDQVKKEKAFDIVSGALLNQGFDIKLSDKEGGLVTTEWKQYGTYGLSPAYDFYLQIKARVTVHKEKIGVKFLPLIRSINRQNIGAFAESELLYMYKNPGFTTLYWDEMNKGTVLYNNVLSDVSQKLGTPFDGIEHSFSQTETQKLVIFR